MKDSSSVFKGSFLPWLLLTPSLIILVIFLYYPMIQAWILSFHRENFFLKIRKFIGFGNYIGEFGIFTGKFAPKYLQVIGQSFIFSTIVVGLGLSLSVILAVLASQKIRGARFYRLLLIWPFALSPAVAATIFLFLFNPEVGAVNEVLHALFGIRPRWLDNPILAFFLVSAAAVWKNLGYNVVFYLAALQNIPSELNEAAAIDGANPFQQFFKITLPMLSPMTFFLVFTNLAFSFFASYSIIDIITAGGPVGPAPFNNAGLTTTMIYQVTKDGFSGGGNTGLAAAMGNLILLIVATLTFIQFRYGSRDVQYGA